MEEEKIVTFCSFCGEDISNLPATGDKMKVIYCLSCRRGGTPVGSNSYKNRKEKVKGGLNMAEKKEKVVKEKVANVAKPAKVAKEKVISKCTDRKANAVKLRDFMSKELKADSAEMRRIMSSLYTTLSDEINNTK